MVQASNHFLAHYILIHNLQIFYWQVGSILGATGNGRDWAMQCKWKAHGTASWNSLERLQEWPRFSELTFNVVKCCVILIWKMAPLKHQDEETGVIRSARKINDLMSFLLGSGNWKCRGQILHGERNTLHSKQGEHQGCTWLLKGKQITFYHFLPQLRDWKKRIFCWWMYS